MTHEMTKEEEQRAQEHIDAVQSAFYDDDPDLMPEPSWLDIIGLWIVLVVCWFCICIKGAVARVRR